MSWLLIALSPALAADVPYAERLDAVRQVADVHPVRGWLPSRDPLGAWAGVYHFTRWQAESGRDGLLLWELVNREFTTKVHALAAAPDCAGSARPTVCGSWLAVFDHAATHDGRASHELWRAHTQALADALVTHRAELEAYPVEPEEKAFWRGRICLIFGLYDVRYPTTAAFVTPVVEELEPPCAPLGAPHCEVDALKPAARRAYVRQTIAIGDDPDALDRCIGTR